MNRNSIIEEMYLGKRGTYDKIPLTKDSTVKKEKSKAVDAFLEKLTPEQINLFDNAYIHMMDESADYATDHFIEGFKIGLLLGIECTKV